MTDQRSEPVTFIVPGDEAGRLRGGAGPLHDSRSTGRLKQSVRIARRRADGADVSVTATPGEDVVVLHLEHGPSLTLDPHHARDLLLAQSGVAQSTRSRNAAAAAEIRVPPRLQWRGLEGADATRGSTRSAFGDVLLSAVDVVTDFVFDRAADAVGRQLADAIDDQVRPGLYKLQRELLASLKDHGTPAVQDQVKVGQPVLVLLHGTFSSTSGTFGRLWSQHHDLVASVFKRYDGQVYALDHPTLGASPIANALALARSLPSGARLHLASHSRGGLVAETFAQVCADPAIDSAAFGGDDHEAQRQELLDLAAEVKSKKLQVGRIVRVACPARGTTLASKRLDAYLSVLKWTMELAGLPVVPALAEFLSAVALRRTDWGILPGLAAQMPDSPLVDWLHRVRAPLSGDLRVIAGDVQGDSVVSWLKTLLSDAFYWTDNDFVVQTRSMYGGAPRSDAATFRLDQAGDVSHFGYFSNRRTAESLARALVDDVPGDFLPIGPMSWAGESSTGVRAARRAARRAGRSVDMPAAIIVPGLMGSNLAVDGKRVWIGTRMAADLPLLRLDRRRKVSADGPLEGHYGALVEHLADTHEAVEFSYDWRLPLEDAAQRLAAVVDAALDARTATAAPVRIVAHSAGALVTRALQWTASSSWNRLMSMPGSRILLLGPPNAGSWTPMQILSGDDTLGDLLSLAGVPFGEHQLREMLAEFPGVLQLQAGLLDEGLGLAKRDTWADLAERDLGHLRENASWHSHELQLQPFKWGVPAQDALDAAAALWKRLRAQAADGFGAATDRLLIVAGRGIPTPDGFESLENGLVYRNVPDGDGRVTAASARLPGVRSWTVAADHAGLTRTTEALPAYVELLQTGDTSKLAPAPTVQAAPEPGVRTRPSRTRTTIRPPAGEQDVLAVAPPLAGKPAAQDALRITIVNGDLRFIRQPLLMGHYRSLRLTGAEKFMNGLLGGTMDVSLSKGLYPEMPGEHQIFLNWQVDAGNPWRAPRPEAVIVAGLGEEGQLRGVDLANTVRQAVLAWAQRAAEEDATGAGSFEVAATLIGSGGIRITVGQSAQLIAQAIRDANERLDRMHPGEKTPPGRKWPRVSHLHLIELYLDRASEAWRALRMQEQTTPGHYAITEVVVPGIGGLPRPLDAGYRGASYDFLTAVAEIDPVGGSFISYTVDTRRARTELRTQAAQTALLVDLITGASNDRNTDTQIGRTLFQLLVPVDLEPFLGGSTEMQIELDGTTAAIPWELLDTISRSQQAAEPWAIRSKLLRKLRTEEFRRQVSDASTDAQILIIGEPECDPTRYPRLAGARREARAVEQQLAGALPAGRIRTLISPDEPKAGADARTVINALMSRDWRIVHVAGHGEPPEKPSVDAKDGRRPGPVDPRGVVLSNGIFLGSREIANMRTVPELVFVNCCHLAARDAEEAFAGQSGCGRPYNRPQFAAGVAEELIKIGVRCVVAAGWAVEDEPAQVFATTFYRALVNKERFLDAVAAARKAAYALGGNTWAAYQCYGDPDWRFRAADDGAGDAGANLQEDYASVASAPSLVLALNTLAIQGGRGLAQRLAFLQQAFAHRWGAQGDVAEAFGAAWSAAGDRDAAIEWYDRALAANDGKASIRAAEQRANLHARRAWGIVQKAARQRQELQRRLDALPDGASAEKDKLRAELDAADRAVSAAAHEASPALQEAITLLNSVVCVRPSMERHSLLGSAYKREAMIAMALGDQQGADTASTQMRSCYEKAEELGRQQNLPDIFYPALNRLAATIASEPPDSFPNEVAATVRRDLEGRVRNDPDFWSVVGLVELGVYEALARGDLASSLDAVLEAYNDLHRRVGQQGMWASVYDQAEFVLPQYAKRGPAQEQAAAERLIAHLRTLAGGTA